MLVENAELIAELRRLTDELERRIEAKQVKHGFIANEAFASMTTGLAYFEYWDGKR